MEPEPPPHFQQHLRDLKAEAIAPETLRVDEKGLAEHNWKLAVIRPIITHPWGSPERRASLRALVGTTRIDWTGAHLTFKESTLELWVRTYEENDGLHLCLAKKVRKDKGKTRVVIRKEWDSAVPVRCRDLRRDPPRGQAVSARASQGRAGSEIRPDADRRQAPGPDNPARRKS